MPRVPVPDLLPLVEKPSRYLGCEVNAVRKPSDEVRLRTAVVFPDLYEIGMSHLGTMVLYGLGNQVAGAAVERVFLPDRDLLELLSARGLPLFTLESRTPLAECDLVGITLQSELTYSSVLTVLAAGGIPLRRQDRRDGPVVIGGGPCAANPEPLADVFDLFFLGDAERAWPAMLEAGVRVREAGGGRLALLEALRSFEGVYDPSAFEVRYREDGTVAEAVSVGSPPPRRAVVPSLWEGLPPASYLVPFLPPVHDRVNVEVARGCTRGCRFCAAGMTGRPVRERAAESTLAEAQRALDWTGYEDLALTSLSIGDYGPLEEVLEAFMDLHERERVSVSLPSMRIGSLTPSVARQIRRVRRTGFTIAPEAGTVRLRRVINKDFSDEEILRTARWVFRQGWEAVKLYFMIGLPTETDRDLDGIVDLARAVAEEAPGGGRVTVNVSPFVPKPFTPFQWEPQEPEAELRRRLAYLQDRLRGRKLQVRWGRTDQALLEAVLSRGDRRLGQVIEEAWRRGAARDGWEEHFRWDRWREAFAACGLDPSFYAHRRREEGEVFPWDHLDLGVSRPFLWRERGRGLAGEVTADCRQAGCLACGACDSAQAAAIPPLRAPLGEEPPQPPAEDAPPPERSQRRIRLLFRKDGDMRFLGHLETVRAFERAARRGRVPLAFSGGFAPKPRLAFALSLPLGVEGWRELADLELTEPMPAEEVREALNASLPEGLRILRAWKAPLEGTALNSRVRTMTYQAILPSPRPDLPNLVAGLLAGGSIPFTRERKGKARTVDLAEFLVGLEAADDRTVRFTLSLRGEEGSVRPQEVMEVLLGRPSAPDDGVLFRREGLGLALEEERAGGRPAMSRLWD